MNDYFETLTKMVDRFISNKLENEFIVRIGIEYANQQLQIETNEFFYIGKHQINGEVLGLKTGIYIEDNSWEFFQKFNFNKLADEYLEKEILPIGQQASLRERNEYLIGYVIGFEKSRYYRQKLRLQEEKLNFQKNITLFKFLIDKYAYGRFDIISNSFLKHVNNWQNEKISSEALNDVKALLLEGRLQRAIDYLYKFYFKNYCLRSMIEVDSIKSSLIELRRKKRDGIANSEDYSKAKTVVQNRLTEWIKRQSN
jgi:hypothetical protein